jgi:hypothetical protein
VRARRRWRRADAGPRALPEGWLTQDAAAPDPVVLGTLDGDGRPTVDRRGVLTVSGGAWQLDWWVGAADGWAVPAHQKPTAIGQRRLDGMPVVETSMRIPGGQAVHRTWCVRSGSADWCVVEVENRSRDAVAVALAVRPAHGVERIGYEGTIASVDGLPLVFARKPAHAATGSAAAGDAAEVVLASAATAAEPFTVSCRDGLANAAFIFPLAHTATLRVAVLAGGTGTVDLAALPDAETVARGWRAHLDAAARIDLPDPALAAVVDACRTAALLEPVPACLGGLDRWGHLDAADAAFAAHPGPFGIAEAEAVARHALLRDDGALLDDHLVLLAKAAHEHGEEREGAVDAIAAALDLADQADAATACRALPAATARTAPAHDRWARLDELVATASPVGTWADGSLARAAEVLDLAGAALAGDGAAGVDLAPRWPAAWLGQPAEAHGLPTRWGRASWAVRWHGARPALLWEVAGPAPAVRAPGLDPSWSSDRPSGEALLGTIEPAGGLPGVVRPLPGPGQAPPEGEGGDFT